jgi:protein TonB
MRISTLLASSILHVLAMSAAMSFAEHRKAVPPTAIRLVHVTPPKPTPLPVETPPEPKKPAPSQKAGAEPKETRVPAPKRSAASIAPSDEPAPPIDTGLTLDNTSAGGGLAVPTAPKTADRAPPRAEKESEPKKKILRAAVASNETCEEPATKPRPIDRPAVIEYSAKARADGVEGRLVLKIAVNAEGRVASVAIAAGVEPTLDASAVAAVKTWRFEPAKRCGRAVESTYTLARRFELGD